MTYILISWSISNKNTRLYTQFIVKNIVQIKYLHCIFMVLYKTISIFPLASLVVLYIYTQKYKYIYTYKYRFKSGCKCNEKNENLQYYRKN